jgi:TOBE domain
VAGPPLLPGERMGWSVRPEYVRLSDNGHYEAIIKNVASFGSVLRLSVSIGNTSLSVVADRSLDKHRMGLVA